MSLTEIWQLQGRLRGHQNFPSGLSILIRGILLTSIMVKRLLASGGNLPLRREGLELQALDGTEMLGVGVRSVRRCSRAVAPIRVSARRMLCESASASIKSAARWEIAGVMGST